jgi:hypothetical protein
MHGLVNRSIQAFLRDTWGSEVWSSVASGAGIAPAGFETMLRYDDAVTDRLLAVAAARLNRPRETILEDLGTYLISHPNMEPLRRLLRFGGVRYVDFLHSLEDLRGRGRLAVPDLDLPVLDLCDDAPGLFRLVCRDGYPGIGHVLVGVLRAMADDYGALVLLDHGLQPDGAEVVTVQLLDNHFATGRGFDLAIGLR